MITFSAAARRNWHIHPAGQGLYVVEGYGWTQGQRKSVRRICRGDTVYVPAGLSHCHGATERASMKHLAVSELHDGENVVWGRPVTDAEYRVGRAAR